MDIIHNAVIPSIAYAFPVAPCSPTDLEKWDAQVLSSVKYKYNLSEKTCTALLRQDKLDFGLDAPPWQQNPATGMLWLSLLVSMTILNMAE